MVAQDIRQRLTNLVNKHLGLDDWLAAKYETIADRYSVFLCCKVITASIEYSGRIGMDKRRSIYNNKTTAKEDLNLSDLHLPGPHFPATMMMIA